MDPVLNEELVLADWARAEETARSLGIRLIRREGVRMFFAVRTPAAGERSFLVACDGYPEVAPVVHFVDADKGAAAPCVFPGCVSGTRPYYQLHPEVLSRPGIADEWRLWRTLATVFAVIQGLPWPPQAKRRRPIC